MQVKVFTETHFAMNYLKSNFVRTSCMAAAVMLYFSVAARAQSIATIDLISAMNELPSPPTSVADAQSKATCVGGNCKADALFQAFDATFAGAQKQWAVINAGQLAQIDSAKHIAGIMQPVAGNNTTTTQKLEAAKQLPGANIATMNLVSKCRILHLKACAGKFAAMSRKSKNLPTFNQAG